MSLEEAGSLDTQSGASYEDTDAQREGHVTTDAEAGVKQLQGTDAWPPADAAEEQGRVLPQSLRESTALPTPRLRTPSLRNSERISYCCRNLPACGTW